MSDAPQTPLPYENTSGITRRGFRLLLVLTFINTLLLGINLMGPQTYQQAMQAYRGWKAERDRKKAEVAANAKFEATLAQARAFEFPKDYVAYTEDPDEALRLISQGKQYTIARRNDAPPMWQAPASAMRVSPLNREGLLFMHERKTPGGQSFLVEVKFASDFDFDSVNTVRDGTYERKFRLTKQRMLFATASVDGKRITQTFRLVLQLPDSDPRVIATLRGNDETSLTPIDPIDFGNIVRFTGGNIHPKDQSRFTLAYAIDGQPGIIDGGVDDTSLWLKPRVGRAVPSAEYPSWELMPQAASTNPAQQ